MNQGKGMDYTLYDPLSNTTISLLKSKDHIILQLEDPLDKTAIALDVDGARELRDNLDDIVKEFLKGEQQK